MQRYEYKVVPAPEKGEKARGVKGTPARFAHRLSRLMNELAREGWEYLRADTLPCEERTGLTSKTLTYQNMLVFRREVPQPLPIFDETTVPGPTLAGPTTLAGSTALGALTAANGSGAQGGATQARDTAADEDAAEEGADEAAGEAAEEGEDNGAVLSAREPKGKAPRLSAFDWRDDASGEDNSGPGGAAR